MSGFAVIGEAIVDIVTGADGTRREVPGGSPANVAVGLARLDHPVTLLTQLGDDEHGDLIRRHLDANGVTVDQAVDGQALATSVARASVDAAGKAHYDFSVDWRVVGLRTPPGAACVHLGSLGAFLEPGATAVREWLDAAGGDVAVSFDPNCRPALLGCVAAARRAVERYVEAADIVKASDEDIDWLYPGATVEDVAARWVAAGPALVVVTRGTDGAYALGPAGPVRVGAPRVDVADTVGAGDSFMSALLDGLDRRELLGADRLSDVDELAAVLRRAAAAAALTCARVGADPPRLADLD